MPDDSFIRSADDLELKLYGRDFEDYREDEPPIGDELVVQVYSVSIEDATGEGIGTELRIEFGVQYCTHPNLQDPVVIEEPSCDRTGYSTAYCPDCGCYHQEYLYAEHELTVTHDWDYDYMNDTYTLIARGTCARCNELVFPDQSEAFPDSDHPGHILGRASFGSTVYTFDYMINDLTGDGALDIKDLVRLKKQLAGAECPENHPWEVDVNRDGQTNVTDPWALKFILLNNLTQEKIQKQ